MTLAEELRSIRRARGHTLREVEAATGISNAYLSQLETGTIKQPSPNFLYKLADFYRIPYELLMERAGYIVERKHTPAGESQSVAGAALSQIDDLTPDEARELIQYLAFLRSRKR